MDPFSPKCLLLTRDAISRASLTLLIIILLLLFYLQVGPTYGHKTMTGLLASHVVRISQLRVWQLLLRIHLEYHPAHTGLLLTDYLTQSMQTILVTNCTWTKTKSVSCTASLVCAVVGYSGEIAKFITVPVRNNLESCAHLFLYRTFGNFRCQNTFVVVQGYENKSRENFCTTNT